MIVTLPPRRSGEPDALVDTDAFPDHVADALRQMAEQYASVGPSELVAVAVDAESAYLRDRLWALLHQLEAKSLDGIALELHSIAAWFAGRVALVDQMAADAADDYWDAVTAVAA